MVKIAHLNDAFSDFSQLEASLVEGQSLQQEEKGKAKKMQKKFLKR